METMKPRLSDDVFLIRSKRVKPSVHRNILISITCNFCSVVFVVGQHSAPYRATGGTIVMQISDFKQIGILLSQRTPVTPLHLIHVAFILALISFSIPPSLLSRDPRYLKQLVLFSLLPSTSMVYVVRLVSKYSVLFKFRRRPYWLRRLFQSRTCSCRLSLVVSASITSSA